MGQEVDRETFDDGDYARFTARLRTGLEALGELLQRPGFGTGPVSIGAELELYLIDAAGSPAPINRAVLAGMVDPRVALEVDQFNLECNTRPVPFAGRPFAALAEEISSALRAIDRAAAEHASRVVTIGILPTLRLEDLLSPALTDLRRYRALSAGLRHHRHAPFQVHIEGEDPLTVSCDDVTLEGANTSLQLHLRVAPADFARTYNAAQIATAPVLAASGNSPFFLGHRLWEETRIALFRQAVDEREGPARWRPARVSFGHGWVRAGVLELFAETVALHPPLLPAVSDEDALACVRRGGVPALAEIRLHHGTVWRWNRAIYDPAAGGHLRIELRALPAGPSVIDMMANTAFLLGLTLGLAEDVDWLITALPFGLARRNFYAAAQHGLDAELLWPWREAPSPRPVSAVNLIPRLLPIAHRGLRAVGVEATESERLLQLIEARVASRMTGARWQRRVLAELEKRLERPAAAAAMLERYLAGAASGTPAHCWPVDG